MSKTNVPQWDTTAANNTDLASITSAENAMYPGNVNNYLREMVSQVAKLYDDLGGVNTVGGTGDVITVTTSSVFTALATGLILAFKAGATNTTNVTLAVDGLAAKAVRKFTTADVALAAGDLVSGGKYLLVYDAAANSAAGAWILINPSSAARVTLTADRTYYVRTDGSDSNTGLANTAGGAFLTIAKGLSAAAAIDGSTFNVTVQVGAGTWTVPVVLPQFIGSGTWTLLGDATTPTNVIISATSNHAVSGTATASIWVVKGFQLKTTTSGSGLYVGQGARVQYTNIDFGACATSHVKADSLGLAYAIGNTTISGAALIHWHLDSGGTIFDAGLTITITGTPAFANAFCQANDASIAKVNNNTFSGSATGTRYTLTMNSICDVNGGGATYLPGNAGGTTATGAQYA